MIRGTKAKKQRPSARKQAVAKRAPQAKVTAKVKARVTAKAKPTARAKTKPEPQNATKATSTKPATGKSADRFRAPAPRLGAGVTPFVEELEVALDELRRLSTELVSTRRELNDEWSSGRGVEGTLRSQLDAIRVELKTARAELEIAQANTRRAETRLEAAAEAEVRARQAQREAEHAADRARDELIRPRREVDPGTATPRPTGDIEP